MEKIQNVRKLVLRRLAVATVATVGMIAGVGMVPPPAQASQTPDLGKAYLRSWSEAIDLEADIDGDELSAEVGAGVEKPPYPRLFILPDVGDKAADDFSAEAEAEASAFDRPHLFVGYDISG